jgi:hypothetical protein
VEADGVWGGQGRGYERERDVSQFWESSLLSE